MAISLEKKTVLDGVGQPFVGYFVSDGQAFSPVTALWDFTTGSLVSFSASSPVTPAGRSYEAVAASSSNQALGATGALGDTLDFVTIIPATTSPGAVTIKDGSNAAITIFAGGTLPSVIPFAFPVSAKSVSGAWQITTGANVSAIGVGSFT